MTQGLSSRTLTASLIACVALIISSGALAGTTGSIRGHIVDSQTHSPLADAQVSAVSASQSAETTTTASGGFIFVSLAPDTYTLTVTKSGYTTTTKPGITVLADQTQDVSIPVQRAIATIGRVTVTAATGLLKPGTTSDIYSVNAAGQAAARALGGPGGIDQAYSAMLSVPGVNIPQGQQGWYQTVFIRGGDQDQVGWELDGIPANRSYDNAPMTILSNIGQQELQVYTGGVLATADASGISGYVNQVIKKGNYPGFADIVLGVGFPSYYNKVSLEVGGATPTNRFTYYAGFADAYQNYRYIDQNNGVGAGGYFYPLNIPSSFPGNVNAGSQAIYSGPQGSQPISFAPGQSYGIYQTRDHEGVVNFHYALPHHNDRNSDDIQFLWLSSYLQTWYYSSINDLGGQANVYTTNGGAVIPWQDGTVYTGSVFTPFVNSASTQPAYLFPSSPGHVPYTTPLPTNQRDGNQNSVAIEKLQYQRNFNTRSYLRIFGYWLYSDWFINGPLSNFLPFGAEVSDYELPVHQWGAEINYTNQLNDQNLLTASLYHSYAKVQRYSPTNGFPGSTSPFTGFGNALRFTNVINPADPLGTCRTPAGAIGSCFNNGIRGVFGNPTLGVTPAVGFWYATEAGYRANLNQVDPGFSAAAISDNWKPNDRWTVSLGVRVENYTFYLPDTADGYPARAFWFAAYNNEFCLVPGDLAPQIKTAPTDTCVADFGVGATPVNLTNQSGGTQSNTVWQPRLGVTYQAGPDDVLRGSYGLFARPPDSRDAAYNTAQQDLASFVGANLVPYGYFTPQKAIYPDKSWNGDISWEHHIANTSASFKLTPYYRSTQNQLQQFILNPLTGLFGSINDGHQTSSGVEFALSVGNFNHDGWAGTLAYTYTHSTIVYTNFVNGRNVIDNVNTYITQYNQYTSACAGLSTALCSPNGQPNTLGFQCFNGVTHVGYNNGALPCTIGDVTNPYYTLAAQPLLNRSAAYTTYDLIPSPFAGANGYATPNVGSVIIQYKHGQLTVTPTMTFSSGASYGSPLAVPGYAPNSCAATAGTNAANTQSCGSFVFIPDPLTNQFDNLGAFKQPSRFTLNLQIGYQINPRMTATLTMTGLVDQCNQRGYAWDYANVCVYSSLPSSILPPSGNFLTPAQTPIQLKYPYAMWLNNNNTGAVGVKNPFQAAVTFEFKPW